MKVLEGNFRTDDDCRLSDNDNVLVNISSETSRSFGNYDTFENESDDQDDFRSRSLSLPHVSCGMRSYTRSLSLYDNTRTKKRPRDIRKMNSVEEDKSKSNGRNFHSSERLSQSIVKEDDENSDAPKTYCGFTKRQVRCGIALSVLSFTDVMGFSIFAPFFPIVAQQKNLDQIQIGLIFAAYSMSGIFGSIITGTLLVRIGAKFIILAGMFWCFGATVCFGLLKMVSPQYFFTLCLASRLIMGFGSSCAYTALFAVIFQEFAERSLTLLGISESLCSIGGIVGPLFGGALYTVGGYTLPFFVLGGVYFVVMVMSYFMIPSVAIERQTITVSPIRLLLSLHGIFGSLFVILSFFINSLIISNLSVFLTDSFGITPFMVGIYMLVFSIFYGISTPLWGYLADSKKCGIQIMVFCGILCSASMVLYGPDEFVRHILGWSGPRQWLVYVMNGVMGVAMGGLIMPTFGEMIVATKELNLELSELAQYGLVSGLWNTMFSIGDILGPSVGGIMVEKYTFERTCTIAAAMLLIASILKIIHIIVLWCKRKNRLPEDETSADGDETEPLLHKDHPSLQA